MEVFLLENEDFIELYKLLKALNWVASGGEAKLVIEQEQVKVNGETETRKRKKVRTGDQIQYQDLQAMVKMAD